MFGLDAPHSSVFCQIQQPPQSATRNTLNFHDDKFKVRDKSSYLSDFTFTFQQRM